MQAILIGFMGSGKTTVGRLLAQTLVTQHADLDDLIVESAGTPITTIFANYGEPYFRQLEQQTLINAIKRPGILSTGGGTPTVAANAAVLKRSSVPVIWLAATGETILERVQNDRSRPLVNDLDTESLMTLKRQRATLYANAADLVIHTDQLSPQEIVGHIVSWLTASHLVARA